MASMVRRTACVAVVCGLWAGGCANYTEPVTTGAAAVPERRRFDAVWDAGVEVLYRYNFVLDRQDRRAGVITTRRMLARHWFEFWRPDAASSLDFWEGALQTVHRQAMVTIRPARDGSGHYVPVVRVSTSRSGREVLEVATAGEAYDRYFASQEEQEPVSLREREREFEQAREAERIRRELTGMDEGAAAAPLPSNEPISVGRSPDLAGKLAAEICALAAAKLAQVPPAP